MTLLTANAAHSIHMCQLFWMSIQIFHTWASQEVAFFVFLYYECFDIDKLCFLCQSRCRVMRSLGSLDPCLNNVSLDSLKVILLSRERVRCHLESTDILQLAGCFQREEEGLFSPAIQRGKETPKNEAMTPIFLLLMTDVSPCGFQ